MTNAEVWQLVQDNEVLLRREVRRYVPRHRRRDKDYFEDLYSDVVLVRANAIMATFKPGFNVKPITHLCAAVRWYAFEKVLGRKYKKVLEPVDTSAREHERPAACGLSQQAASLAVQELLGSLPPTASDILTWHLIKGYTFEEIAVYLEITRAQAKTQYQEALELARGVGVYGRIVSWLGAVLDATSED